MSTANGYRYDPARLLAALEDHVGPGASAGELAAVAGVARRTIFRWRAGQRSVRPHAIADRVESLTGVHIADLERPRVAS